jgi:hypothetical protein
MFIYNSAMMMKNLIEQSENFKRVESAIKFLERNFQEQPSLRQNHVVYLTPLLMQVFPVPVAYTIYLSLLRP